MSGDMAQQIICDEYHSTKSFNFFVKDPKVKIFSNNSGVTPDTIQKKERKQKVDDNNSNTSGSSNNQVGGSNSLLDSEASGSLGKNSTSVQTRKVGEHHLSHWFLKKDEPKKMATSPQRGIVKKKKKQRADFSNVLLSNSIEQYRPNFQPLNHQQQYYQQTPQHQNQQPSVVPQQHNAYNAVPSFHNVIQTSYQQPIVDSNAQRGFVPYTHQYQSCSTQNNMMPTSTYDPTPNHSPNNYPRVCSPVHRFDGVSGRPCWDNIGPYCNSPVSNCSQKQSSEQTKAPFGGIFEKPLETLPPLSALLTTPPERIPLDLYKPQPAKVLPSLSCLLYNKPEQ